MPTGSTRPTGARGRAECEAEGPARVEASTSDRPARRPLPPRRRLGREPERAHARRRLAGGGRPPRDARGGRRGHPPPLGGRRPEPPRPEPHRPERPDPRTPDETTEIVVSGFGPKAADLAGRIGDGYACTGPAADLVDAITAGGGEGKPVEAGVKVCWNDDEGASRKLAHELWAQSGAPGELNQELPMPAHFEQATELVTEDLVAESVVCGPDPERYVPPAGRLRPRRLPGLLPLRGGAAALPVAPRRGVLEPWARSRSGGRHTWAAPDGSTRTGAA